MRYSRQAIVIVEAFVQQGRESIAARLPFGRDLPAEPWQAGRGPGPSAFARFGGQVGPRAAGIAYGDAGRPGAIKIPLFLVLFGPQTEDVDATLVDLSSPISMLHPLPLPIADRCLLRVG